MSRYTETLEISVRFEEFDRGWFFGRGGRVEVGVCGVEVDYHVSKGEFTEVRPTTMDNPACIYGVS